MPEDDSRPRSAQWRHVDETGDPGHFVSYLESAAAFLRERSLETLRLLEATSGSAVLDVGCGTGDLLIELATMVEGIRAVGIDVSAAMVETARSAADARGVAVQFALGDAQSLEFPDASFNRIHCSRVLVHIERPAVAVEEMARVLAPGGRPAISEPDFDALMIDSDDLATTRAVREALTASLQNPDVGRRLRRLVLAAGLEILEFSGWVLPVPSLQFALAQFQLLEHLETAVTTGAVSPSNASAWRAWLESADAAQQCMVAPVGFRVLAGKHATRTRV